MRVLVTGGAGYIGVHLLLDLLLAGLEPVVLDDFSTGHRGALDRVAEVAGRRVELVEGSVRDPDAVRRALAGVEVVFHLAGLKRVDASMIAPERTLAENVGGVLTLAEEMERARVRRIVYSSSAAVYAPAATPRRETDPTTPQSPYGQSKLMGEQALGWMAACRGWQVVSLRYFNPVGAHPSGRVGEHARDPGNLVPRAMQALLGEGPPLQVHGTDYDTADGTCLRDYVHVVDLAAAHRAALGALVPGRHAVYNVGTGQGCSVRQVLAAVERAAGRPVPAVDGPRRPGDLPQCVADPGRMARELGFRAQRGLDAMVESAWAWRSANPRGYDEQR